MCLEMESIMELKFLDFRPLLNAVYVKLTS